MPVSKQHCLCEYQHCQCEDSGCFVLSREDGAECRNCHFPYCYPRGRALHFSEGKLGVDQIPVEMLEELARVFDYGAKKYARDNWKKGVPWHEFYGSALRHIFKWWQGEDIDPESNCLHLAHAICNLTFLLWYSKYNVGLDDRAGRYAERTTGAHAQSQATEETKEPS